MARIKITDLAEDKTISNAELRGIRGGLKIAPSTYFNFQGFKSLSSRDILSRRFNVMEDH